MNDEEQDGINDGGRQLQLYDTGVSADSGLHAFLAGPEGVPVYHGFPIVPETMTDGWYFGAITEYEDPDGILSIINAIDCKCVLFIMCLSS